MKRIFKFLVFAIVASIGFTSCDEDTITNDSTSALYNGNALYGFNTNGQRLNLPESAGTYIHKIQLDITSVSNVDRVVSYQVLSNTSDPDQLVIGDAVIPANSHNGYIELIINTDNYVMGDFRYLSIKLDSPVTNSIINPDKELHNIFIGIPCLEIDMEGFYKGTTFFLGTSYHNVTVDLGENEFTIEDFFEDIPAPLVLKFNPATYTVSLPDPVDTGYFHPAGGNIWVRQSTTSLGEYDACTKTITAKLYYYIPGAGYFGDKTEVFKIF